MVHRAHCNGTVVKYQSMAKLDQRGTNKGFISYDNLLRAVAFTVVGAGASVLSSREEPSLFGMCNSLHAVALNSSSPTMRLCVLYFLGTLRLDIRCAVVVAPISPKTDHSIIQSSHQTLRTDLDRKQIPKHVGAGEWNREGCSCCITRAAYHLHYAASCSELVANGACSANSCRHLHTKFPDDGSRSYCHSIRFHQS